MEKERVPKTFLMGNSTTQAHYETKNKMGIQGRGGRDGKESKMKAPSEGEQGPEGAVASYMNKFTYRT
jgi:hypothetical protein